MTSRANSAVLTLAAIVCVAPGVAAWQTPKPKNACLLVDREDMEKVAGGKITLLNDIQGADQTNCEVYRDGASKNPVLMLEVHWADGKKLAQSERRTLGTATRAPGDKDVDVDSLLAASSAPAKADDAYYRDGRPAWILKGDVIVRFTGPGLAAGVMKKNFVGLARKALARMP